MASRGLVQRISSRYSALLGRREALWLGIALVGVLLHAGTALLRLDTFVPYPRLLDFASYYVGAWSLRLGYSGEEHWQEVLRIVSANQNLALSPTPPYSTPVWQLLVVPMTVVPFPAASTIWLVLLVGMCVWAHFQLAHLAGCAQPRTIARTLPLTLTFGPLFLNLTLGQSGPFLLVCMLLLMLDVANGVGGERRHRLYPTAVVSWLLATAAKVFPGLWAAVWGLSRRWKDAAIALACALLLCGLAALVAPKETADYWTSLLPVRALGHMADPSHDDQSLIAFMGRLAGPTSFSVSGLSVEKRTWVTWDLPWQIPEWASSTLAAIVLAVLGWITVKACLQCMQPLPGAAVCLVVLFTLMLVPHMERYNHILVLPAMAWLCGRGVRERQVAIGSYALFGLSRLNHLWVRAAAPVGPLLSGLGLAGVLLLWAGIVQSSRDRADSTHGAPE